MRMPDAVWPTIALGMVLGLAGCGPAVRSTPFETFPPRPAEHPIRIYSTQAPDCPYEEVGLVSARRRYRLFTSMSDVLEALKERRIVPGSHRSQTCELKTGRQGCLRSRRC